MGQAHCMFRGANKLFANSSFLHKVIGLFISVHVPKRMFEESKLIVGRRFIFVLVQITRYDWCVIFLFSHLLCLLSRFRGRGEEGVSPAPGCGRLSRKEQGPSTIVFLQMPSPLLSEPGKAAKILVAISVTVSDICHISPLSRQNTTLLPIQMSFSTTQKNITFLKFLVNG